MTGSSRRPLTVAAVDLGSNSFHMVIARFLDHDLHVLDRVKETVRLGGGLDEANRLTDDAQDRALACLQRFGQRLRNIPAVFVRAVGTNALRQAQNAQPFLDRAHEALGHPVEIIPGQEEARLIYLGVSHSFPADDQRRLVIDIGGGSTEVILGKGFRALRAHSLYMGCVTYSRQYFPKGAITREAFREAEVAAQLELKGLRRGLKGDGWASCVGSSGTILAIREILKSAGWAPEGISFAGLKKLRKLLVGAERVDKLDLPTVKPDRAKVLPGGLAILIGLFKSLEIQSMVASSRALREGVLYDLVGRIRHEDVRDRTIRRMVEQFHVDLAQADRVELTAQQLLDQLEASSTEDDTSTRKPLTWASKLHEIGLAVSHTGFHRHGEYLARHTDMPGFSAHDQALLACLIRCHRRKVSNSLFAHLPEQHRQLARRLCVILRLAVLLNRSRQPVDCPSAAMNGSGSKIRLSFPEGWGERNPLTLADLAQEASYLEALDVRLLFEERKTSSTVASD